MTSIRTAIAAWGWPGGLGAALLVLALFMDQGLARAWTEETDALSVAGLKVQEGLSRVKAPEGEGPVSADAAAGGVAALPPADERDQRLASLLESARASGLRQGRMDIQNVSDPLHAMGRIKVNQALRGHYDALRAYIEARLASDPALSLDRMQLRRASPLATDLEAELSWSFYHQRPEGPRP